MWRSLRRKARFARKIKFLLDDILTHEFGIVSCEIIHALTDIEDFDFGDVKFTNSKSLLCPVSLFEEELKLTIARSLFESYQEVKCTIDIIDEPKNCCDFNQFKKHISDYTHFNSTVKNYYVSVIVPAFNTHIATKLTSIFGEEI